MDRIWRADLEYLDPMTSDQSDSLIAALSKARIPAENHPFIQRLAQAIGIAGCRVVDGAQSYVAAKRRDGHPDLHIYYGYTTGFLSEDEAVRAAGSGVERSRSSRKGFWYVAHPITRVRPGSERARDVHRNAGFCDCGMQLSMTGVCDYCD